jgi:hypothetical protein
VTSGKVPTLEEAKARFRTSWERVKAHMAAKNIDHAEPDPSPFKVHLMTRAGRVMRERSELKRKSLWHFCKIKAGHS